MRTFTFIEIKVRPMNLNRFWQLTRRVALALLMAVPLAAAAAPQETFATPEAAVAAFTAALKADSDAAMVGIFGEKHKDLLIPSDRAEASATRAKLLAAMQTLNALQEPSADRRILIIGDEAWPFPIPIVRAGDRWRFDTDAGRRRGRQSPRRGERAQCDLRPARLRRCAACVCGARPRRRRRAPVRAEARQHAGQARRSVLAGRHVRRARRKVPSVRCSPKARLISRATPPGEPYRGYYFRILTRQGKNAPGGAYSYVINGRMIAGFAMVAFPAEYGKSGVMTFIVSHNGKVYERDLGKDSAALGAKMTTFDPGPGWNVVPR